MYYSFSGSSAGKEPTCNAGDPCSIPRLRKSPGEGIGYPLQYSWASLMAQTVKNPRAVQDMWVQSLGWKDPMVEVMATHFSILAWKSPWTEEPRGLQSTGSQRVGHNWATKHTAQLWSKERGYTTQQKDIQVAARAWLIWFMPESEREYWGTWCSSVWWVSREFPGRPVVRTLCSHCWGPRFNPWLES